MVVKYGLVPHTYQEISCWGFANFIFSWDHALFADGSKARCFGFHEFIDTEAMFLSLFANLRQRRIIP